jgi:hypothetical protein
MERGSAEGKGKGGQIGGSTMYSCMKIEQSLAETVLRRGKDKEER